MRAFKWVFALALEFIAWEFVLAFMDGYEEGRQSSGGHGPPRGKKGGWHEEPPIGR